MKKYKIFFVLAILVMIFLSGCADVQHVEKCLTGHVYGFWGGLWHGAISPLAFIGSWFSDDIAVWAVNNNGGWYAFGFLLGVSGFFSLVRFSIFSVSFSKD